MVKKFSYTDKLNKIIEKETWYLNKVLLDK